MTKQIKLFFETNVILGAVQDELLTSDTHLKDYITNGLIERPDRYISSRNLIDFVLHSKNDKLEPFVSYTVKREIRRLLEKEPLREKIIGKLRIESKIKKLSEDDKKIFEIILYQIFFIKLPSKILDILDQFSSVSINEDSVENIREEVFQRVFRPLLQRYNYLKKYFDFSGEKIAILQKDKDYQEFLGLSKGLDSFFKFKNYKKINDLIILSEAIYVYDKMKNELTNLPEFYFVSCDHIFIPFRPQNSNTVFFKINNLIKKEFEISVVSPKYLLNDVLK